eukprot:5060568-Prymnesium_polylepis.2
MIGCAAAFDISTGQPPRSCATNVTQIYNRKVETATGSADTGRLHKALLGFGASICPRTGWSPRSTFPTNPYIASVPRRSSLLTHRTLPIKREDLPNLVRTRSLSLLSCPSSVEIRSEAISASTSPTASGTIGAGPS